MNDTAHITRTQQMAGQLAESSVGSAVAEWPYQRTLVLGMGKTGMSVVRFLSRRGLKVAVNDNREHPPGLDELTEQFPDVGVFTGRFQADAVAHADVVLVSPGIPLTEPVLDLARQAGVPIWGDIELFARFVTCPVVAITGSNGKSTVTLMLETMARASGLQAKAGGNLGTPALDLLDSAPEGGWDLLVLELSSFQLERTENLSPAASTVLNISADHMDRYANLDAYARSKSRIYCGSRVAVVNKDDPLVQDMVDDAQAQIRFSLNEPGEKEYGLIRIGDELWLSRGHRGLLSTKDMKLVGRHNHANTLAALALGEALGDSIGLDMASMLNALRDYEGLPHRTQWVGEYAGLGWINDSKGTNVGATVAAIDGLLAEADSERQLILIAGGQAKGADFSDLASALPGRVRAVVLFGEDAKRIRSAVESVVDVTMTENLEGAVEAAAELGRKGDTVLFSPACASFDLFSGFEERGRAFMKIVRDRFGGDA